MVIDKITLALNHRPISKTLPVESRGWGGLESWMSRSAVRTLPACAAD